MKVTKNNLSNFVVTAGSHQSLNFWDISQEKISLTKTIPKVHGRYICSLAHVRDEFFASASGDKQVKLWNAVEVGRDNNKPTKDWTTNHTDSIWRLTYNKRFKRLIGGSYDGRSCIIDPFEDDPKLGILSYMKMKDGRLNRIVVDQFNEIEVGFCLKAGFSIHDMEKLKEVRLIQLSAVFGGEFGRNGIFISKQSSSSISIYDKRTLKEVNTIKKGLNGATMYDMLLYPNLDDTKIVCGTDSGCINFVDIRNLTCIAHAKVGGDWIQKLEFINSNEVVSVSNDNSISRVNLQGEIVAKEKEQGWIPGLCFLGKNSINEKFLQSTKDLEERKEFLTEEMEDFKIFSINIQNSKLQVLKVLLF